MPMTVYVALIRLSRIQVQVIGPADASQKSFSESAHEGALKNVNDSLGQVFL